MGQRDRVSMLPATGTSAGLDASSWAETLGWRAGCQQLGTLYGVSKTKCEPLEWHWGPIFVCAAVVEQAWVCDEHVAASEDQAGSAGEWVNKVEACISKTKTTGGASCRRQRGVLASCWRDCRVRGSPGERCVSACVSLRQDCSGVGYRGTRESQPAVCDGLYQQLELG